MHNWLYLYQELRYKPHKGAHTRSWTIYKTILFKKFMGSFTICRGELVRWIHTHTLSLFTPERASNFTRLGPSDPT